MGAWPHLVAAVGLSLSAVFVIPVGQARAQNFDDRWSVVPKANADEAPRPAEQSPQADRPRPNTEIDRTPASPPVQPQINAETDGRGEAAPPVPRAKPQAARAARSAPRRTFVGAASYYAYKGGKTASGEAYRRDALTAAHRTLPFGTKVRVTDVKTKKSVDVVITDRGPAIRSRVLDLSFAAAEALGIPGRGVIQVRAEVIGDTPPPVLGKGS